MNPHDHDDLQRELELFRREAEDLDLDDDQLLIELETADAFITRMKAQDVGRRTTRRRWLVGGGSIAAGLAVTFAVLQPASPPAVADAPPVLDYEFASAVRIAYAGGEDPDKLLSLLSDAARQAPPTVGTGEVQYKLRDSWFAQQDDASSRIVPEVRESWLSPDGSLVSHTTPGPPLRSDGRGLSDEARPNTGKEIQQTSPPGTFDTEYARELPRDPAKLADVLMSHGDCRDANGYDRSMCIYNEILFLFQNYVLKTTDYAVIWTMLRGETGFVTLGSVEDRVGRNGVGISIIDPKRPQYRHILIGSLETGQPLGYEQILIKPIDGLDVKPPSVSAFSAFIDSRLVAEPPRG